MSSTTVATHGRLHALDGLRASMLLLGLVLHTLIPYGASTGATWPYQDTATSHLADYVVAYIHVFRMPIFFLLAGFFAAMLALRRGAGGLVANRLRRIVLPGAIALIVLFPLTTGGFTFANAAKLGSIGAGWAAVQQAATTPEFWIPGGTIHLWFLYFLVYFYALALGLKRAATLLPATWRASASRAFRSLLERPVARVAVPGLVTAATLLPMRGALATPFEFVPYVPGLVAYGVFFGFGWLLYRHHDLLATFKRGAWLQAAGSVLLFLVVTLLVLPLLGASREATLHRAEMDAATAVVRSLMGGLCAWLTFFGVGGLFLRHLDGPSPAMRYLVDASYWVYLVHLPIVIGLSGLIVGTQLPVWLRIPVVLGGTTGICFASYALFVRPTFIGQALDGRRYVRGLPATAPATPQAGSDFRSDTDSAGCEKVASIAMRDVTRQYRLR